MALKRLKSSALKLILFGGKGGVGKTTCATSASIHLAEDFKTLLISTDPAHSLSDSLGQEFSGEIQEVQGVKNLSVLEINAAGALSKFKLQHEYEIKKILDTSTYLDAEDIDSVFSLPIPGMDEVMGFRTIVDLIEEADFDKYIVDTAPTGHALRLLTLPDLLDDWIKVMAKMRWKYRYMVAAFSGKYEPDEGDNFLLGMKKTVKRIEALLRDQERCEFIAVTIPEKMAIFETEKLIDSLRKYKIAVNQLVINNVLISGNCKFCEQKKKEQKKYITYMKKKFKDFKITIMPLQPCDVTGLGALGDFKELLCQQK